MKKKKVVEGILIVLVIVAIIVGAVIIIKNNKKGKTEDTSTNQAENSKKESYVEEIEDGVKINKSNKLNEAKQVDGLTITNIQLTTKDGMTTLLADVKNDSGARTELKTVQITLLDKEGKELVKLTGVIGKLEVGETTQLNIAMTSDYVSAYDFTVSEK